MKGGKEIFFTIIFIFIVVSVFAFLKNVSVIDVEKDDVFIKKIDADIISSLRNEKISPEEINESDYVLGDLNAPVKVLVYSDFNCPFCASFAQTMEKVRMEFSDKVVIAFRYFSLNPNSESMSAAMAAECAGEQGEFWNMHNRLFEDSVKGELNFEKYKEDAFDLGLDADKFEDCFNNEKTKDLVLEEIEKAKVANVFGTPTCFVNDYILPGAYPFDDFIDSIGESRLGMKSIILDLLGAK